MEPKGQASIAHPPRSYVAETDLAVQLGRGCPSDVKHTIFMPWLAPRLEEGLPTRDRCALCRPVQHSLRTGSHRGGKELSPHPECSDATLWLRVLRAQVLVAKPRLAEGILCIWSLPVAHSHGLSSQFWCSVNKLPFTRQHGFPLQIKHFFFLIFHNYSPICSPQTKNYRNEFIHKCWKMPSGLEFTHCKSSSRFLIIYQRCGQAWRVGTEPQRPVTTSLSTACTTIV